MKFILALMALMTAILSEAKPPLYNQQLEVIKSAFDTKDCGKYDGWLSDDCTALGKSGQLLLPTIKALFAALEGNTIDDMRLVSIEIDRDSTATFIYDMIYSLIGQKQACFSVNSSGKISRLDYVGSAKAQTVGRVAPMLPPDTVIKIPFALASNNLIIFEGLLNGEKRNFIFDSGAKTSILNSRYMEDKTADSGHVAVNGANSRTLQLSVMGGIDIDIMGIKVVDVDMLAKDLSYLEPTDSTRVYGLIGMDIFGDYDILFDYGNLTLTLLKPSTGVDVRADGAMIVPYDCFASGYLPCVKANVGGEELTFGIDCGATVNMLSDRYMRLVDKREDTTLTGISGDVTPQKQGCANLLIGSVDLGTQSFVIGDLSHFQNLGIDGLIGFPVLSAKRIMLRNSTKELIIY